MSLPQRQIHLRVESLEVIDDGTRAFDGDAHSPKENLQ
jgi:hypothetical protein